MQMQDYSGTYKRYKLATATVIEWLVANSSTKRQYVVSKARQTSGKTSQKLSVPCHIIIRLANEVANASPAVVVPTSMLRLLASAIRAREWCSQQPQKEPLDSTAKSAADGHRAFIDVLLNIRDILSSITAAHKPSAIPGTKEPINPADNFSNAFESLHLEELDGQDDFSAVGVTTTTNPKNAPQNTLDIQDGSAEEAERFAVFCFLFDCYRIREYLADLWHDNRESKINMMTAALTTDTAVDVIRRMHADMALEFPGLEWHEAIDRIVSGPKLAQACTTPGGGRPETCMKGEKLLDRYDGDALRYETAYEALKAIRDIYARGKCLGCTTIDAYPDRQDWYEFSAARRDLKISSREIIIRVASDCDILLVGQDCEQLNWIDQITRGFHNISSTKTIPSWMVVASQILVDIHWELRERIAWPYADLVSEMNWMMQSAEHLIDVLKANDGPSEAPASRIMHSTPDGSGKEPQCLLHDLLKETRNILRQVSSSDHEEATDWMPYKYHPVLCGKLACYNQKKHASLRSLAARQAGVIIPSLHLYHAALQHGYLENTWPAMEAVSSSQDLDTLRIYKAGKLTPLEALENNFYVALGIPVHSFARNLRKAKGGRDVTYKATTKHVAKLGTGLNLLNTLVPSANSSGDLLDNSPGATVVRVYPVLATLRNQTPKSSTKTNSKGSDDDARAGLVQLLQELAVGLEHELPLLRFNYLGLARDCLGMLMRLKQHLQVKHPEVPETWWRRFEPPFIKNEARGIVAAVLALVSRPDETPLASRQQSKDLHGKTEDSLILRETGLLIGCFIRELEEAEANSLAMDEDEADSKPCIIHVKLDVKLGIEERREVHDATETQLIGGKFLTKVSMCFEPQHEDDDHTYEADEDSTSQWGARKIRRLARDCYLTHETQDAIDYQIRQMADLVKEFSIRGRTSKRDVLKARMADASLETMPQKKALGLGDVKVETIVIKGDTAILERQGWKVLQLSETCRIGLASALREKRLEVKHGPVETMPIKYLVRRKDGRKDDHNGVKNVSISTMDQQRA